MIERHGAVSEPTAVAMADGVRERLAAEAGIAPRVARGTAADLG
ncbi:MAG: hypothetical protein HC937_02860 [Aquincola sp.]|nr:hypothetical protein [Aquincola sp.]